MLTVKFASKSRIKVFCFQSFNRELKVFCFRSVMIGESHSTDDGLEVHMGVNYVGHFLLTRLLEDNLIKGAEDQVRRSIESRFKRIHSVMTDMRFEAFRVWILFVLN